MAVGTVPVEIRHFHLFAGLGGGAKGFNRGAARVGNQEARFRSTGCGFRPARVRAGCGRSASSGRKAVRSRK